MGIFNNIQTRKPKRNKFDMSHERKMSMKMGGLYPTLVKEVVPGDSFKVNTEVLIRLAPMLAPIMHRVDVTTHYFFVPNRLVWNEWEDFITGGPQGDLAPPFPQLEINEDTEQFFVQGQLPDYMGIPPTTGLNREGYVSALPFRAYQLIYNEFYRDQNLTDAVDVPLTSGVEGDDGLVGDQVTMRTRAWEKDYFTSCLPWSQRGGEAQIPLGTIEPNYKSVTNLVRSNTGDPLVGNQNLSAEGDTMRADTEAVDVRVENLDPMNIDATTINELRKATKLQTWLEKSARGGSRYIEQILSHFGVRSSDARLQRPEYLGGGRQPVVISEVLSTATSDAAGTPPQGEMAGHGISVGRQNGFSKTFEEHGHIIGIISVTPKTTYQQGLNRMWSRTDKFDFYWPEFAHLGEQEVLNKELYFDLTSSQDLDNETFGYQQRYAEYKYAASSVHGDFRNSLAYWHMGRIFNELPSLNTDFVEADPTKRIFAVEDEDTDELYVQLYHNISALRPMPYFSIPSL